MAFSIRTHLRNQFLTPLGITEVVFSLVGIWFVLTSGAIGLPFAAVCLCGAGIASLIREYQRSAPRPWWRAFNWFFVVVSAVFATPLYLILTTADLAFVDEAGLEVPVRTISADENAYVLLADIPEPLFPEGTQEAMADGLTGEGWNDEEITRLLKENQKGMQMFELLLEAPAYQNIQYEDVGTLSIQSAGESHPVSSLRTYAQLYLLEGHLKSRMEDSHGELHERAVAMHQLASKIESSNAYLVEFLVALSVRLLALDQLERIGAPGEVWDRIEVYAPKAGDVARVYVIELYYSSSAILHEVWNQVYAMDDALYWQTFYTRPYKTQQLYADNARWVSKQIEQICSMSLEMLPEELQRHDTDSLQFLSTMLWRENVMGEILYGVTASSLFGLFERHCDILNRIERRDGEV